MCKRYYVEVQGLTEEDGMRELVKAGVPRDQILVVEELAGLTPLTKAINQVTGITVEAIGSDCRKAATVNARIIFAYNAIEHGEPKERILGILGRNSATMLTWYMNRYNDMMKYDRSFRTIANQVTDILDKDENWAMSEKREPKKPKFKSKDELLDKLQLRIPFEFDDK